MSTLLHMPTFGSAPYGMKDKNIESFVPAFTSVNRRNSLSPLASEQKLVKPVGAPTWSPVSRPPETGYQSSSASSSPTSSDTDRSPESPNKRRRSDPGEADNTQRSQIDSAAEERRPLDSPQVATRNDSSTMEVSRLRSFPPSDRPDAERRRATEPREMPQNAYQDLQHRLPRITEPLHPGTSSVSTAAHSNVSDATGFEDARASNQAQTSVQVELKKRKRQFANRTKTGCGTCRRRKKKCDEAKPECNNCTRGGFLCSGYASRVPWPKPGITKPHPPLQAKERTSAEVPSIYNRCTVCNQIHVPLCEPPRNGQAPYAESHLANTLEGARSRPIAVEEHERKPPAPSNWGNGWSEAPPPPPRASYAPEQPPAPYVHPPSLPSHERHPPQDHHAAHSHHGPLRQHSSRVYHHTPQSMSQVPASTAAPTMVAKTVHHPTPPHARQAAPPPPPPPSMAPTTNAPPDPPIVHYAPPRVTFKSEKEKMVAGQPFLPFDRQLVDERTQCTGAIFKFNSTANAAVSISEDERKRYFKTIVAARWIPPHTTERPIVGHLGGNVHVAVPFHCDYGYNLSIAENVVIGSGCRLSDSARIAIGRNTKIGKGVTILTEKMPTDTKALKGSNGTEIAQEVFIGENVYIGDSCVIYAGVRIGDGAIVRAGSVVVGDISRECVAYGNPAH